MKRRINIHVEELALSGISRADRSRVAAGLRRELAGLFRGPDLPTALASGGVLESVATKPITLRPQTRAEAVGREAAREIWRSLGGAFK